jgi:hypothetical protein
MKNFKKLTALDESIKSVQSKDTIFSIKVYTGIQYEDKCGTELHPVSYVKKAESIIANKTSATVYSNNLDFISAIFYLCKRDNINCEFFLNDKSVGFNIEPIFMDFNKALELIDKFQD